MFLHPGKIYRVMFSLQLWGVVDPPESVPPQEMVIDKIEPGSLVVYLASRGPYRKVIHRDKIGWVFAVYEMEFQPFREEGEPER